MISSGTGIRIWGMKLTSVVFETSFIPRLTSPVIPRHNLMTTCSTSHTTKTKKQKVIVISGPTGAGKSRLALELAKRLNGEIISADSVQVYRGLDIGSAKPSFSYRQEVPHHLVDILHPAEDYSVGQFFEDARQATKDVLENGHVPIIAGGTGLYLRWYVYGKPVVPQASPEIVSEAFSEIIELQKRGDWDAAVQLLVKAGDLNAKDVPLNNWYRLKRSLEIIKSSGSPPSAFHVPYDSFKDQSESRMCEVSQNVDLHGGDRHKDNISENLDYDFMCFFLSSQRLDLYRQIDFRCEDMLSGSDGILSEATQLLDLGLLPNSNSATKAIGYRHAMEFLLRCQENGGGSARDFLSFLTNFQTASRNFAKRQMTWFRNEQIYQWLNASQPLEKVVDFISEAYHDQSGNLVVVPESLQIKKDLSDRRVVSELKSYRAKNRLFISREDCNGILNSIKAQKKFDCAIH